MTSTRSSREERKNSSFRRVFRWSMGYNRIVTIFYTLFLLGMLPVAVLLSIIYNLDYYADLSTWEGYTPQQVATQFGEAIRQAFNVQLTSMVIPLAVLFLVVWCARNFGYMQGRRSVDLFHSIPVRRAPLFMGSYLAGLVSALLPLAVSVALTELLCALYHVGGVMANPLLYWQAFAVIALSLISSLTMTAFFMVVSGNPLNWFLMTAATALGWPVTVFLCDQTMNLFLPGYVSVLPATLYTLLCPYFASYAIIPNAFQYLLLNTPETYGEETTQALYSIPLEYVLWWVVFGLVLLGLTVFYYQRRKSECAENSFSFPAARGAVRSLMTIGGALGLGIVVGALLNSNLAYFIGLILGAIVAHTVYQVVITRGFRRFWLTVPAFLVTCILLGGGLYTLYTGGAGYVLRVPDSESVAKAEFTLPGIAGDESKESYLAVSSFYSLGLLNRQGEWESSISPWFGEPEDLNALCTLHSAALSHYPGPYLPFEKEDNGISSDSLGVTYTMKDGSTLKRLYSDLPFYRDDKPLLDALAAVQKTDTIQSYLSFYSTTPKRLTSITVYEDDGHTCYSADNSQLTDEEKENVWNTFVEELNSAAFSNPSLLLTREESLERQQQAREDGSMEDWEDYQYDVTSSERSYTIYVGRIPASELSSSTAALLQGDFSFAVAGVDGSCYTVPKCCTKTRALIDELTEPYGDYTYYDADEDEDPEEDQSAPDEYGDDGWEEFDTSIPEREYTDEESSAEANWEDEDSDSEENNEEEYADEDGE